MAETDEWCDFSDLLKATCSHCKDAERKVQAHGGRIAKGVITRPSFRRLGQGVVAQYEGWCSECGGRIEVGDIIKQDPPESGTWIHQECPWAT